MSELLPGQLEVDGLRLGRGTPYVISEFTPGGKPEAVLGDRDRPRGDGRAFGKDTLSGRTIELNLSVDAGNVADASRAYGELARTWNQPAIRRDEGAYVTFRARMTTLPARVAYGRCREFDPANEWALPLGRVDVVASFDTLDHLWYADTLDLEPLVVPIMPPPTGGWAAPFTAPIAVATTAAGFGEFTVGGTEPTPLVARLHGPIVNPTVEVLGAFTLRLLTTVAYDQWVDIDTRPWRRTVLRNDGVNLAGTLSSDTPPLSELLLTPGGHEVVLRGTDPTGTARLTVEWQSAATTPYWI